MALILAFSSHVAFGHVGLSAMVPALNALGHEVIAVPTVVLSNHYGYANTGGASLAPAQHAAMIDALAANGWLRCVDAVLTGYLSGVDTVAMLAQLIGGLRAEKPDLVYQCDPVLGDDPKGLYVGEDVAAAIRDHLVPLADIVTPNRFELAWLAGNRVESVADAARAAGSLGVKLVAVTSVPAAGGLIGNFMRDEREAILFASARIEQVPHGTGDLFAALLIGHLLNGASHTDAVARASAGVTHVITHSEGGAELNLVEAIAAAVNSSAARGEPIQHQHSIGQPRR